MRYSQRLVTAMRVYDVNLTGASATESGRTQETQKSDRSGTGRAGSSGSGGDNDRVEFSSTLGRLSQALAASGAQRASRVQQLSALYQSGSYVADSMATSQRMVADALRGNQP
jgi:hypothetical protein